MVIPPFEGIWRGLNLGSKVAVEFVPFVGLGCCKRDHSVEDIGLKRSMLVF
jgi:hypothetical protein